jgi:hypothetical protein
MQFISGSQIPVFCRMEVAPITGSTTTINPPYDVLVFTNPGTIAAQTITLPATPTDGYIVAVCSVAAITALTLSPAVTGGPSAMTAGGSFRVMYSSTFATPGWFVFA